MIIYNLASRSRPQEFFATLDNLREMSANKGYAIVAKLDNDDPKKDEYLSQLSDYPEVSVKWGLSRSKIHAINRDIDSFLSSFNDFNFCIGNLSDDIRFTVKGFDEIIYKHCGQGDFVHFPEVYKMAACSVVSIMGREYYEKYGYIYHPDYYSLWADVEATEIAKLDGAYKYVPEIIFRHDHYSTIGKEKDYVYNRNNTYKRDKQTFLRRRKKDGPLWIIKYPTRGRWRLFFDAINNIYSTIQTNNFKIIVNADEDDVEMNCGEVRDFCNRYHGIELHYGQRISKIEAVNRNTPYGDIYLVMSDDMKFTRFGWDTAMLNDIGRDTKDWFGHWNDGFVGNKLPTMNICDREYYNRDGFFYNPGYKSVSCDAENMYVAQMRGRYHYFDSIYFNHLHPANLRQPSDRTYRENDKHGDADTAYYFERLKRLFDVKNPVVIPEEIKPFL